MRLTVLFASAVFGAAVAASAPSPVIDEITSIHLDQQQQTELNLKLGGSAARLPKLAIPAFLLEAGDSELQQASKTLADVLWKDLEFERGYQMISQTGNAASVPPAPADALAYETWNQIGADEVLVGTLRRTDASLQVDVRVMSVERKVSTFAKRYSACSVRSLRLCAHTISDELHKMRFGIDGIARTKFAFVSDRAGERMKGTVENRSVKEIYTADYDGENVTRLTNRGSLNVGPSWSPDGRAIVYQAYPTGFADIYIQRLFEVQVQPARPARGTDRAQNMLPAWSPDGNRIAFQSNRDGKYDIYTVKPDGSDLRRLTNDRSDDTAPAWNPTGTQIAFTSDRGGSNQIYIMSADGGPATKLTDEPKKADRPTWAAGYIAYSAEVPGSGVQLRRIDVATRKVMNLTDGPGTNESPTVAPNGRHIAFVHNRGGRDQIAIMDADGTNMRIITTTGNSRFPAWSPAPRGQ
jgi:TolB protein